MKCFNCGEKGHPAKECPDKEKEDEPLSGLTLDAVCSTSDERNCRINQFYEVSLDNGSQVNIVDPRLLTNLRSSRRRFHGMSGSANTERVGDLEGFFECQACDMCPPNLLSMSDVEDLYPITYIQHESITVCMDHRDLVFSCRKKCI
jgi:hypothetical protein